MNVKKGFLRATKYIYFLAQNSSIGGEVSTVTIKIRPRLGWDLV